MSLNPLTVPTTLYLGEHGGEMSPRLAALVDAFNDTGLGTKAVTCIKQVQWEKLLQICLANAFSVPNARGPTAREPPGCARDPRGSGTVRRTGA